MEPDALVREARRAAHLTQTELARRLGTTQPAVVKLERPGANPTIRTLELTAPEWSPGIDVSLIRKQLELPPAERLRQLERQAAEMRRLVIAGARSRGELS